ncbi:EF-hand calcium-binding domain-containing protein 7-like isoform X3 [Gigantopelta aegis]|uniref:EF-hand calcium-binding domain-containing protein 7-like isoform X3 n=1 Tax=Gigantopelta aegis TaxID=1735272 RepID=UPI001B888793|nr:EF-hand calcium-binding domain-containing protein 7-like isoform X3 [Gigantopelta aegis]
MSRRSSRPSSATSHGSRSSNIDRDFKLNCKAAYLSVFDDIRDEITSKNDLILVLQQSGRNPSQRTLEKYWKYDTDSLTFNDFVDICQQEHATTAEDLMKAFKKIDVNGDGYISLDELHDTLTSKGEKMSEDEVRAIIDEVDENKDGRLDYAEEQFFYIQFCNMMMKTVEESRKMAMKIMEKKERKKQRSKQSVTPRKDKEEEDIQSSRTSLQSGSGHLKNDLPKPSPRVNRDRSQLAVKSHLQEPNSLSDWTHNFSRGCFYLEDGKIINNQYSLSLPEDCSVWFTIKPIRIGEGGVTENGFPVDTALFILRDRGHSHGQRVVTFTEQRDSQGKYGVRCDLKAGKYKLIPFSTGCRLTPSRHHPKHESKLVQKDKHNNFVLTKVFRKALDEIFDMVDLDENGLLSREEFNLYTWRTSGDEVADEEWDVVETNCDLQDGQITREGFLHLTEMEAKESDGDEKDLWITLENMGYDKSLVLSEACPFRLDVYTEDCENVELKVSTNEPTDEYVEEAVCESVVSKGESSKIKGMRDLTLYNYIGETRATIVVKNGSSSQVSVELDCSGSRNCISNPNTLQHTVSVPAQTTVIGYHLLPHNEKSGWTVQCSEKIVK